jgi:hypothetical protein
MLQSPIIHPPPAIRLFSPSGSEKIYLKRQDQKERRPRDSNAQPLVPKTNALPLRQGVSVIKTDWELIYRTPKYQGQSVLLVRLHSSLDICPLKTKQLDLMRIVNEVC